MTLTAPLAGPSVAASDVATQPVTLRRVIASELIKFRTLRSTLAVLGGAVLGMVVIALLVAYNTRTLTPNLQPDDILASSPLQGYYLGQLLIGALGVLFVTGEYSTGMIRATLVAVPRRLPVLWAKLVVFTGIVASVMIPVTVLAWLASQALLSSYRPGFSLSDPGVARVVIGTGVYLTLVGVIAAAIGWIVRSTPGSLVAYIAVILVVPVLLSSALGNTGKDIAKYLPTVAGGSFVRSLPEPDTLSAWPGLLVLIAWAVVAVGAATVVLRRRDS